MEMREIIQELKLLNKEYLKTYKTILKKDDEYLRGIISKEGVYKLKKEFIYNSLNQTALAEEQKKLKDKAIIILRGLKSNAPEIIDLIDWYQYIPGHEKRFVLGVDYLIKSINKDLNKLENIKK